MRHRTSLQLLVALSALLSLSACPTTSGGDDDDGPIVLYPEVVEGSLVITEIHAHPNVGRPEFIEVVNASDDDIDLLGCKIVDGGAGEHEHDITTSRSVAPGELVLMGDAESLGSIEGEIAVDVVWIEITLSQTDELEVVGLRCPDGTGARRVIDEVSFHWNGLDLRRGHSWQLVSEPDAGTNDDPTNWCEAPIQDDAVYAVVDGVPDYGTPGDATVCETPGGATPSSVGDLVITEILVDEFTGLREWFELHNPGDEPLDLRGCVLGDAPVDGSTDPNTHTMDAEVGNTVLEPNGWFLLAKTDLAVVDDSSVEADYAYGSLGFNNSDLQHLWLDCPSGNDLVRIDEIIYDWGEFGGAFEGRSIALSADALSAELNDESDNWCLAGDDDLFWTTETGEPPETFEARGTPGTANPPCPVPDPPPGAGEMVFTEILARSAGAEIGHNEEWFEMLHTGETRVSLVGCTLRNDEGDDSPADHVIEAPLGLSADPGDRLVFVKSSAEDTIACGLPYDYAYGTNVSFNNDSFESLTLLCGSDSGEIEVDSITFDGGFLPGIPWQVRSGFETAADNDASESWCNADDVAGYTWSCTVGADTNYGTPGGASSCL